MRLHAILDLVACAGHLAVGNLVLLRPTGSRLGLPLGLLALDLFAWNFADFAYTISGRPEWHWLDLGLSPFSPALAFHLVAIFVGRTGSYRWLLLAIYSFFAGLAATAWLAFWLPAARSWLDSLAYSITFLGAEIAVMAFSVGLLVVHLRGTASDASERRRTKTMAAAFIAGAAFATTDFWNDFGVPIPSLGNVGTTVSALLMAAASLRLRFFGENVSNKLVGYAVALAAVGLASYLALFRWLNRDTSVLAVATVTVVVTLGTALREIGRRYLARRDRIEGFTTMGRFSAHMAHDLRNPLAALKGAIQFLNEEIARGESITNHARFLNLIGQQVDRIHRVIDDYQRVGYMQPRPSQVNLNDSVREVLALERFAAPGLTIETELDEDLPLCFVDRELVGRAVENLIRNAAEAMPQGGAIRVVTAARDADGRSSAVTVSVQDTGQGMDARQVATAFEEFYTTKAEGSGLGLAFVRRVVRVHGGDVKITSSIGRGTTVTMHLPVRRGGQAE